MPFKTSGSLLILIPFSGLARRKCSIESHWLLPDFSSCVTSEYEELYQRVGKLFCIVA